MKKKPIHRFGSTVDGSIVVIQFDSQSMVVGLNLVAVFTKK